MTATAAPAPARDASASASPWLFGPVRDLVFGCGLLYLVVFAALAAAGDSVRAALPIGLALIPSTFVSGPHYGATLLRVYERGEDRARYRLFAVWTTLALAALFVWGLHDVAVGSWVATVYLTWSPWHYAGQNFGIAMMFLRRRGGAVTPPARRLLWWSFALSFALTFLALHGESPHASYAPDDFAQTALTFHPLGIPGAVQGPLMVAAGLAYLACTVGAFALLARGGGWRGLLPPAALVFSQALWFTVPTIARQFGVLGGIDPLATTHAHYAFLWIGFTHSAQYLWITSYYAVRTGGARRHAGFFVKSLCAGAAIWTIPAILFAPGALGRLPYDAGLALSVSAFVNLHHFVLDGAIWKLRDGKIARVLLAGARDAAAAAARPRWGRAIAVAGGASLVLALAAGLETELGFNRAIARGDLPRAERAAARLAWIGRDGAEMHLQIADRSLTDGDAEAARRHFRRAIDLQPSAWAWVGLGQVHARDRAWKDAAEAFGEALALEPGHAVALFYAGIVDLEDGRRAQGRERILRARSLASDPDVASEIDGVIEAYSLR